MYELDIEDTAMFAEGVVDVRVERGVWLGWEGGDEYGGVVVPSVGAAMRVSGSVVLGMRRVGRGNEGIGRPGRVCV